MSSPVVVRRRRVWPLALVAVLVVAALAAAVFVLAPRWQGREDFHTLPSADAVFNGSKQPEVLRQFEGSGYGAGPNRAVGVWFGKPDVPAGPINIEMWLDPATVTRSGTDIANAQSGPGEDNDALKGIGDEVYGTAPDPDSTTASIRLRIRNVRVDITYRGLKGVAASDVARRFAESAVREVERVN